MRDVQELYDILRIVYEDHKSERLISPAWLATEAMQKIDFPRSLHELGYLGCHLQLRQVARAYCRQKFDIVETSQDDLFPETLQERYPLRPRSGEEPQYGLLSLLSDDDIQYNIERMERIGQSLIKHADALRRYQQHRQNPAA